MKNSILVYSVDENHSHSSKYLIGVFDTIGNAWKALAPIIKENSIEQFEDAGYEIADKMFHDETANLARINQTQGFSTNYIIDTIQSNTIIL